MSNNPRKISALEVAGIAVNREPLVVGVTDQNRAYLQVKRDFAGHLLPDSL
jgi:GTP cyclohydrolase II